MNKKGSTFIIFWCVIINFIIAQDIEFNNEPYSFVFKTIEEKTNYTFNYDSRLWAKKFFTGKINLQDPLKAIDQILYDTPFIYEKKDNIFLIVLPPKKKYTISGSIKNNETLESIPYVNIYCKSLKKGTQSDEDGNYILELTAYKNEKIFISHLAYRSKTLMIRQLAANNNILLAENKLTTSSEIVIKDYILKGITEGKSYSSLEINFKKLREKNNNRDQDLLKIIQLLPGISSYDESLNNINIRGSSSDQNLILWEGVTLYNPSHFFGMISVINPFVVDEIDIYKSVFQPGYGNTIGGIIDIGISDQITNRFSGGLGLNLTEASADLNIPLVRDKLSLILSARNSINELLMTPTFQSYSDHLFQLQEVGEKISRTDRKYKSEDDVFNFYDLNAKLIFKPNDKTLFKSSYLRSYDQFKQYSLFNEGKIENLQNLENETTLLSNTFEARLNSGYKLELRYRFSDYSSISEFSLMDKNANSNRIDISTFTSNKIKDSGFGIVNKFTGRNINFDIGYLYELKEVELGIDENSIQPSGFMFDVNSKGNFHNVYSDINYHKDHLELNAGLKKTYYREFAKWYLSPRLNLQYSINKNFKLKASAGKFYQFVNQIVENDGFRLNDNSGIWVLNSTSNQNVLNADKFTTGITFNQPARKLLFDVEAYYHRNNSLSGLTNTISNGIKVNANGSSDIAGIDILLNKNYKNYKFSVNYDISNNKYLFPTIQENEFPASNHQLHKLNLVANANLGNWKTSLSYNYKSGLPYSTMPQIQYFADQETYRIIYPEINDGTLKSYSRLDIGLSYLLKSKKNNNDMMFDLSVINVLNTKNVESLNYYLIENEVTQNVELINVESRLLGITPQILFRYTFK